MDDEETTKDSESPSDIKEVAKEKLVARSYDKDKIPKENIKTQKVTNTPNLISQLEPSAPKGNIGGIQSAKLFFSFVWRNGIKCYSRKTHSN